MAMRLSMRARGAQAGVDAVPQPDGDVGRALDVEVVGAVEGAGVTGGRPGDQQHRVAAGMVPPSNVRSSTENRPWYCDGGR